MFSMPGELVNDKLETLQELVNAGTVESVLADTMNLELEDHSENILEAPAGSDAVVPLPSRPEISKAINLFADDAAQRFASQLPPDFAFRDSVFLRIVSGSMDRHVVTGEPLRPFDFMVQRYLPVGIAETAESGLHLAPVGAPMALTLRQCSFDALASGIQIWSLGKGVFFAPRPRDSLNPGKNRLFEICFCLSFFCFDANTYSDSLNPRTELAHQLLTELLQQGESRHFFLQDDEQQRAFHELQSHGLACWFDEASGRIAATASASRGVCMVHLYHTPIGVCEYMSKARVQNELDDHTVFDLLLALLQNGWREVGTPSKGRVPPYKHGSAKTVYYHTASATLSKLYLRCLLQADNLFAKGVDEIHVFQLEIYYRALLQCNDSQAKHIVPHLKAAAYRQLMGWQEPDAAREEDEGLFSDGF